MSVAAKPLFAFDNTFVRELPGLYEPWQGAEHEAPALVVLNGALAKQLGVDVEELQSWEGVAALAGSAVPEGAEPVAQAYAGHQFGGYSPRLGDGRALLLGEVIDTRGVRQDVHLKGSGATPFSRGGDGKAAIGPMLREFAISEAMHNLGIPTARALAVVATGESVARETLLPGAVLTRIAESHLRVGTFEYTAALRDEALLRKLADYAIARHHPAAADAPNRYLALFEHVIAAQADLIARWMLVGFVHGVMNTDNMAISGQTIDYGPCAFMDRYDLETVFSSIDHGGRYAYGNQPSIAQWDLARLGEALLPLLADAQPAAVEAGMEALRGFVPRYQAAFGAGLRAKLGLGGVVVEAAGDPALDALADDLLSLLQLQQPDFTSVFRALSASLRSDESQGARALFPDDVAAFDAWAARWREALATHGVEPAAAAAAMDRVNPVYIPRNHLVEAALTAATVGDLQPFGELLEVLEQPFTERPGLEAWAQPGPAEDRPYRTFCGT
ncbi:MAG: YdiU family protein [Solirubrobacterales bacterium]|nr:YdiU family protein [Solirubrobacterales bacterium]